MKRAVEKKCRRELTGRFYLHNHIPVMLGMLAVVLNTLLNLAIAWQMQQLIDLSAGANAQFSLLEIACILMGLFALMAVIMFLNSYARPLFLQRAVQQYRDYAFEQLLKKGTAAFGTENTSFYLSAMTNDIAGIEANYLTALFTLPGQILMLTGALGLMLYYSLPLTLTALAALLVPLTAAVLTGNGLTGQEKRVSDQNADFLAGLKDMLGGFAVIKSFRTEKEICRLFSRHNADAEREKYAAGRTRSILQYIGGAAGNLALFAVFLAGAALAVWGHRITAGVVLAFVQLMGIMGDSLAQIPQTWANRKAANALIDKLAAALNANASNEGDTAPVKLYEAITLKNLNFAYEEGKPVLREICYRFRNGGKYAIVGSSGSGKSMLLQLLQGCYAGYQGQIYYDDRELRGFCPDSLYDLLSVIQQNVFLFNSSIRENITMFREFPDELLAQVIRLSGLDTLVAGRGEEYRCGENGCALSGGERQRISIAHCLLRETPVILVDEATSSLDPATAKEVMNSILGLQGLTATGSASSDFESDLVVWRGSFSAYGVTTGEAYGIIKNDSELVKEYLLESGVTEEELVFSSVDISRRYRTEYDENGNYIRDYADGYDLNQSLSVTSDDIDKVEKISRDITKLIESGVQFSSFSPEYYCTRLDEVKLDLIQKATENAKQRVDIMADGTGCRTGELLSANLGVFQITAKNSGSGEYSYDGAFDTSSRFKTAMITVRLNYEVN